MSSVGVEGLQLAEVAAVARGGARVALSPVAAERVRASRRHVEMLAAGDAPAYGINTGFGALATTPVSVQERRELQRAFLRSHAAGAGPFVDPEIVRATMLIRAKTLAAGYSGVRLELLEALIALLNAGVIPTVPEHGSLGASGDLAPMAHIGLCLAGEGWALRDGAAIPAGDALATAGLKPIEPVEKEGLALTNGTDGMLALLALAIDDLRTLLPSADITAAMSIEALFGTDQAFREELHALRPHPGQLASARNLHRLLQGSPIVASHRHSPHLVQDAYSLRCTPQVYGAARDTLTFASQVAERELGAVTDNPVILRDGSVASAGNFHGAPLAFALDFLAIAAAEVGAITERRVDRLLDPARSEGLPAFLTPHPGTNSGFMIAHYTAASLAEENRRLSLPASTGSLPVSAGQEDHNSMGWSAGMKLRRVIANLAHILGIEALCAAQALDLRAPLKPGPATGAALQQLRQAIPFQERDIFLAPDIAAAAELVRSGGLLRAVAEVVEVG